MIQSDLLPGALQASKSVSSLWHALTFPGEQFKVVEKKQSHCSNFPPTTLTVLLSLKRDKQHTAHPSAALLAPCVIGVLPPQGNREHPLALTVTAEEHCSETMLISPYKAKSYCFYQVKLLSVASTKD